MCAVQSSRSQSRSNVQTRHRLFVYLFPTPSITATFDRYTPTHSGKRNPTDRFLYPQGSSEVPEEIQDEWISGNKHIEEIEPTRPGAATHRSSGSSSSSNRGEGVGRTGEQEIPDANVECLSAEDFMEGGGGVERGSGGGGGGAVGGAEVSERIEDSRWVRGNVRAGRCRHWHS